MRAVLTLISVSVVAAGCGGGDASPTPLRASTGVDGVATVDDLAGARDGTLQDDAEAGPQESGDHRSDAPESGTRAGGGGNSPREGSPGRDGPSKRRTRSKRGGGTGGDTPSPTAVAEVKRARAVVSDLIDGLRTGDGDVCTRVMTQRYVETITKHHGEGAVRECRSNVAAERLDAHVEAFGPAEYKADRAIVRVRLNVGNKRVVRVYDLRRTGGRWRVDAQLS